MVDITTTGRRSGRPRRVTVAFHSIDGRIYISGMPGFPRDWLANVHANPRITFHLIGPVRADLPAVARPITDPAERRPILEQVARNWRRTDLDRMVAGSPLIEVTIDEPYDAGSAQHDAREGGG
jgi:deazaflavin-dependent oxidoreductase (nitroreductase family)